MLFVLLLFILILCSILGIFIVVVYSCAKSTSLRSFCARIFTGRSVCAMKNSHSMTDVESDRAVYELKPIRKIAQSELRTTPTLSILSASSQFHENHPNFTDVCLSAVSSEDDDEEERGGAYFARRDLQNYNNNNYNLPYGESIESSWDELREDDVEEEEEDRIGGSGYSSRQMRLNNSSPAQIIVAPHLSGTIV